MYAISNLYPDLLFIFNKTPNINRVSLPGILYQTWVLVSTPLYNSSHKIMDSQWLHGYIWHNIWVTLLYATVEVLYRLFSSYCSGHDYRVTWCTYCIYNVYTLHNVHWKPPPAIFPRFLWLCAVISILTNVMIYNSHYLVPYLHMF